MQRSSRFFFRNSSPFAERIHALIGSSSSAVDIGKSLCSVKPGTVPPEDWSNLTRSVIDYVSTRPESVGGVIPSLVIASAASGNTLSYDQKVSIAQSVARSFDSLSLFDKVVFTIGCSQVGLRTGESVDVINRFLTETREKNEFGQIPKKLLPGLALAVANLGINNSLSWNHLLAATVGVLDSLPPRDIVNVLLAITTSRTFPIAAIEAVIDRVGVVGCANFSPEDALSLFHSMCTLEVYRGDLVRGLLDRISKADFSRSSDADLQRLLKQGILSLFLDPKAAESVEGISPTVFARIDAMLDWSSPELQRHHGQVAGEIQQLLSNEETENGSNVSETKPLPITPLIQWNREIAVSVAIDRFYVSDIPSLAPEKLFVHIDDETFPDMEEGPIDPFLQLKHSHIARCGWKLLWVKEQEWLSLEDWEAKQEFIHHQVVR